MSTDKFERKLKEKEDLIKLLDREEHLRGEQRVLLN